ncbi:helix-turn-helix domain-containing protein [Falsigemmobacter faecalis]|uniref:Helix-turn-helix domain-containing protein n=1 Tax=Falsigemmobacter faecalis TaxID=2488730 RepID=A0A3P3DEK0_9RHOB|nr:helix-turn-helix domain-containing protein [Falsigemmobacter faecalis]RRH72076.1 helix-turn-helix domain-containing protein [Falsigemmobacter faecalis]
MPVTRRLSDAERLRIPRDRAAGQSVRSIAARLGVSERTICNVLRQGRATRVANGSRSEVLTLRVSRDELFAFDALLGRLQIAHRSAALRRMMGAAAGLLAPDPELSAALSRQSAALNRLGSNVNQIARRLNEARLRGEVSTLDLSDRAALRALAGLFFETADQFRALMPGRRLRLDLELDDALQPLLNAGDQDAR